jgi:hypothetical protein
MLNISGTEGQACAFKNRDTPSQSGGEVMFRHLKSLRATPMAAVALAVTLRACGEFDEPANPVRPNALRMLRTDVSVFSSHHIEPLEGPEDGGQVVLARHSAAVPPGALEDSTVISISVPDPLHVMADFDPDGLEFKKPVQISISYRDLGLGSTKEENLTICLYDPNSGRWVDEQGKLDTVEKTVAIWVDHCSRYALSDH